MGDLRSPHAIAGVVLAGGRSSRMGVEKALVDFAGRPMLAHVLARFAPQVMALAINANGDPARFAAFGAPVIADLAPDQPGPLAGIAAALAWAQAHGCSRVATVPCDAPFLPRDLVARLARQRAERLVVKQPQLPVREQPISEQLLQRIHRLPAAALAAALPRADAQVQQLVQRPQVAQHV
jgi:molybdenum cofactor guanylyltransferase